MLVRLGEYRGHLETGQWTGREDELPKDMVDSLLSAVLSPKELAELDAAIEVAEKSESPARSHPVHQVLSRLLDESPATPRSVFDGDEGKYLDDLEMSRLMSKARSGDVEARNQVAEILPPVLKRKAARQLYFLNKQDQEEIVDEVLFSIIRGNFAYTMEKVQTDDSHRALASYLTTAMFRGYLRLRKKQEANGTKLVTATDLDSAGERSSTEVLDHAGRPDSSAAGMRIGAGAAGAELERLRRRVIALLPVKEAAALDLKLKNPSATLAEIAAVTGAKSPQAASNILERALEYAREIEDVFKSDSEEDHLSRYAAGLADHERNAFSLISFGGKSVDQVASMVDVRATSVKPSYLAAVGKMEAEIRAKNPKELDKFWDKILLTSGFHAGVLNDLVDFSLGLGRLPKSGEFPEKLFGQGWSEEQVYGTNNFRVRSGKPVNALFFSRSHVNWLICREIARRKPFMQNPDQQRRYQAFDPFLAQLAPREETYLDSFVAELEDFRGGKQKSVIDSYVRHFMDTGVALDIVDELPQHIGLARRRLMSEGDLFSPGGRFEGTGVFRSKSHFQERLAEQLMATDVKLAERLSQVVGVDAKNKIEDIRKQIRELLQVSVHSKVNITELPMNFRSDRPFVSEHFAQLHPLEQNIVSFRWGQKQSVEATATQLGISPKQVVHEELLALRKLREMAMQKNLEVTLGREIASVKTSLPSLVTEHLYESWKKDPRNFDFGEAWKASEEYVAEQWPGIPPKIGSQVFRGKDHAVWMLREKIQERLRYLKPEDGLYQEHIEVVDRGANVARTGKAAGRNPYRGHLAAQSPLPAQPEPPPKVATKTKALKTPEPIESANDRLLREAAQTWGTENQRLLASLRNLRLTQPQRAVIRGKWMNRMSNDEVLASLPKKLRRKQALIDAETSLLYELGKIAEVTGKTTELALELADLPTLQKEIGEFVLPRISTGMDTEKAVDEFYEQQGVKRATAVAWKTRPFLNYSHRDLVLVELAKRQGDRQLVGKLLQPYKSGGRRTGGTVTVYRTELMRLALELVETGP